MKQTAEVVFVGIAGFLLGSMAGHQTIAKAQSEVRVYTTSDSAPGVGSLMLPGSQLVGFSCIDERVGDVSGPKCYYAYVK
jgi:hypothetical protein